MTHCITVARIEDHPFWDVLADALIYEVGNISIIGKWEKVYANEDEMISENKDEINSTAESYEEDFNEAIKTFMENNFMEFGYDGAVYQKVTAQFDYCGLGYEDDDCKLDEVMKYKDVVEKSSDSIYAFIAADYDFICTDYMECPFADDDLVYVINGHL